AFLVAQTRLLDVDIDIADGADHAEGIVHAPAGVRVRDESVSALQFRSHRMNTLDVRVRVAADLQLEARVSFGPIAGDLRGHRSGFLLRDGAVEADALAVAAAKQRANGQSRGL